MEKNTEIIRKKILFRSWHRGTKEMDHILGNFVKNNINKLNNFELNEFFLINQFRLETNLILYLGNILKKTKITYIFLKNILL